MCGADDDYKCVQEEIIKRHDKLISAMSEKVNMLPAMHALLIDVKNFIEGSGAQGNPGLRIRTDRLEVWRDDHASYHAQWGMRGWAVFMLLLTNLGALGVVAKLFVQLLATRNAGG